MVTQAFETGAARPDARPTAAPWHTVLAQLTAQLRTCAICPGHVYPVMCLAFPWCEHLPAVPPRPLPRPQTTWIRHAQS